jgi:hypothetical protein
MLNSSSSLPKKVLIRRISSSQAGELVDQKGCNHSFVADSEGQISGRERISPLLWISVPLEEQTQQYMIAFGNSNPQKRLSLSIPGINTQIPVMKKVENKFMLPESAGVGTNRNLERQRNVITITTLRLHQRQISIAESIGEHGSNILIPDRVKAPIFK